MASPNMFQVMTQCLKNEKVNEEDLKVVSPFLMCRWLAGNPSTLQAANFFNTHSDIPIEAVFKSVRSAFLGKVKYIPYPKGTSENVQKDVEILSEYYNIRHDLAKEYMRYMSDEQLQKIRGYFANKHRKG